MRFFLIIGVLLTASCGGSKSENKQLIYQNIVIFSDLSSRVINKPSKDVAEIGKIVQFFKNECVKPGEKIGDKSSIRFSTFSNETLASVDLNKIKNLGDKQQFINSTGKYQNNGFEYEIQAFEEKVKNAYATIRNPGLDLISVLVDKIENGDVVRENTTLTNGIDTTYINYDNHVYIFTDGYLEYLNKGENKQFYFGVSEINKVRQFCIDHNVNVLTALERDRSLGLPVSQNDKNGNIHLHIRETHERDKNDRLQTYKYAQGLRDNEILAAVWSKWAKESGFKSFEWKKY